MLAIALISLIPSPIVFPSARPAEVADLNLLKWYNVGGVTSSKFSRFISAILPPVGYINIFRVIRHRGLCGYPPITRMFTFFANNPCALVTQCQWKRLGNIPHLHPVRRLSPVNSNPYFRFIKLKISIYPIKTELYWQLPVFWEVLILIFQHSCSVKQTVPVVRFSCLQKWFVPGWQMNGHH
jgi:hypothetical protein